jgi:hypothetical protein
MSRKPAVGVQALVHHDQIAGPICQQRISQTKPASDVDQAVLLARHGRGIGTGAEVEEDLGHTPVLLTRLPLLDEPGVFHRPGGVEDHPDTPALGVVPHRSKIGQRDWLPPSQVDRGGDGDVGNGRGAHVLYQRVQLLQVDVALEPMLVGRIVRLVDDHIVKRGAGQLLVGPGGGEIHVAGHVITAADQQLGENVLGPPPLVGGNHELEAVIVLHRAFQPEIIARSGVGFIAHHDAGPLAVRHGVGAGVGQKVDVDILGAEQEGVESGLSQGLLSLGPARHPDRFHHLDLPGLGPAATRHGSPPSDDGEDRDGSLRRL